MDMKRMLAGAAALAAISISTGALAADEGGAKLSSVNGQVLVNQGQGFTQATPGMALRQGDRVLVTNAGQAGLSYGTCRVTIAPGSIATISSASPCNAGLHKAGIISGQPAPVADDQTYQDQRRRCRCPRRRKQVDAAGNVVWETEYYDENTGRCVWAPEDYHRRRGPWCAPAAWIAVAAVAAGGIAGGVASGGGGVTPAVSP